MAQLQRHYANPVKAQSGKLWLDKTRKEHLNVRIV
jgi:hypothetical protein